MYVIIFLSVVTNTFRPYIVLSIIPVDGYICVRSFYSRIFILCLYVRLDHFFYGLDLAQISNNNTQLKNDLSNR